MVPRIPARLRISRLLGAGLVVLAVSAPVRITQAGDLDKLIQLTVEMNTAAAQSQARVASMNDETSEMTAKYRSILEQVESLRLYHAQVESLVGAQDKQLDEIQGRIDQATAIGREVTPLMMRMVDALEAFVKLDVPFLPEERTARIAQLRASLNRPELSEAEKFRLILEAYQVENEYGRTVETYRTKISVDNADRTVDVLRVGRIALLYLTLDGSEVGVWRADDKAWTALSSDFRRSVREGIRIAKKQSAPNLFRIPLPLAKEAS
ncbi:MAG: DUF3450 domain-containing protein [Deltaproteobacteria bacterium]|nr:DUF3450 domain-containing protein [Deltaproteobacteria bacterium]